MVVSAALLVVVLLLLIAQDQEVLRVKSPLAAGDRRFPEYVGSVLGAPVSIGDRYTALRNGDEIFPAMLDAIRAATHRISFESFIYSGGDVSAEFTTALADAALRGVTVRLVLDAYGSSTLPPEYVTRMTDAGVQVKWFNPFRPWTLEVTNYRTHRKVLVVDGTTAFTGGVGVADHWRGDAEDKEHWRDTQFRVNGPAVRALEASFYENWIEAGGIEAPALDPEEPSLGTGARSVVVWSNASGGASNVKMLYLLSIAGARSRIDIQSPYFILDESTRWSLTEARRRGVRVRVLTEGDATDALPVKFASRQAYQSLLDAGDEIYEYQPTMMHVKAMVVDGVWSVFGSANFDNRSLELNDELTVGVADRELASTLIAQMGSDLRRSAKLDPAAWRERSMPVKFREYFWSYFNEVF
jgi:cardiolipin synthase